MGYAVLKGFADAVRLDSSLAIELDGALAGDNLHALGFVGAEMELAGINQAQGLFALIGKKKGMTDDPTVEINVRFGDSGHFFEF